MSDPVFAGKKTILVTGGAGFIGSRLCSRLASLGHRVIALDNYFTGSRDNHVAGVDYREGHTKDIGQLVPEKPDLVYHLGEYSRVEKSLEDPPELVWDLNKTGTFAVLEFCRKKSCKIVYAGSSTKFSDGGQGRDLTPYTWTKASNTDLVRNYGKWYGLPFAIAYFYNVYGPGEISHGPYSTLIGIFSEEFRRGRPLTVVSPGTQRRNFTHVDDIVDGLLLIGAKGEGDEFGIGAAEAHSVLEVAGMFGGEVLMLPERRGNRMDSSVDSSRVSALGWKQRNTLAGYVKDFIQRTKSQEKVEKRVLVFSTTFFPVMGLAEDALMDCMAAMPEVKFDLITTAFSDASKNRPSTLANVEVTRVGNGNKADKFLLPYLGLRKAMELSNSRKYLFAWSILASYASLAGIFFKRKADVPLLISLADQRLERMPWHLRLISNFMLGKADQVSVFFGSQARYAKSASNLTGDVFANQIRFAYNAFLKERYKKEL